MQLKITIILNRIMIIMSVATIAIVFGFLYVCRYLPEYKKSYLAAGCLVVCAMFISFWLLETWLDKYFIEKMVKSEKIALANITEAKRVRMVGDSACRGYLLYELQADVYDQNLKRFHTSFVEKFDVTVKEIPIGTVYITYDENNPDKLSLIPTMLLYRFHNLEGIVRKYEGDRNIDIKYLYVYYRKGFIMSTMKKHWDMSKKVI